MSVTQFSPASEVCTASMTSPLETGEHFGSPVSIGYYTCTPDEIWIDAENKRCNIQTKDLNAFIKELRRAAKLAQEQKS